MKITSLFIFFFLISCASKKEINRVVEFKIIDKLIKDNSFINLEISNKTNLDYYLPIIYSSESEKWKYGLSSNEKRFFFIYKVVYNAKDEKRYWYSENCLSMDTELAELHQLWKKKKAVMGTKDLILLKSNETKKIQVPMNLHIVVSQGCTWELDNYRNEKEIYLTINYSKKEKKLANMFLSTKTIDSLKAMGYELYDEEINSNKVQLIIEN